MIVLTYHKTPTAAADEVWNYLMLHYPDIYKFENESHDSPARYTNIIDLLQDIFRKFEDHMYGFHEDVFFKV